MSYPIYYVPAGDVLPILFSTYDGGTGASLTMSGLAVTDIEIYKDGGTTQRASDAGYTLLDTDGIDFDGLTGIHGFSIDTGDNTDASFYTVGAWFHVVVSAITVDVQTVSFIAAAFRIMAAEGVAGVPDVNVTHVSDTAQTAGDIIGDTNDIQSRLPAALVSGRIDASVGAMAANVMTAAAAAADLTTELQSGLATAAALDAVDNFLDTEIADIQARLPAALVSGRMASDMIAISGDTTAADELELAFDGTAGAVPMLGVIDQGTAQSATATTLVLRSATPFGSDDACNGATLWAFGSTQGYWQSRSITDYTTADDTCTVPTWDVTPSGTITYKIFGTAPLTSSGGGATAQEVWEYATRTLTAIDEDNTTLDLDATIRGAVGMSSANLDTQLTAIDDFLDTEIATIVTATGAAAIRTAVGLASANLDTQLGDLPTNAELATSQAAADDATLSAIAGLDTKLDTIDNFIDTEVAAIKAKTDSLTFTVSGKVDANITHVIADPVVESSAKTTNWGGTA